MSNTDIIIFLGPSLPLVEAQKNYPNATYLPPVRAGDIIKVLRLTPKKIVIIDGVFESKQSIWHKEILFALWQGVSVIGGVSMGALRAAELEEFGMIGYGKIYTSYSNAEISGDDEVAIRFSYAKAQDTYTTMSDSLVSIRATIQKALNEGILDEHNVDLLLNQLMKTVYYDRKLYMLVDSLVENGDSSFLAFKQWLDDGNFVDQKRLDTLELLSAIDSLKVKKSAFEFNASLYFRAHYIKYSAEFLSPLSAKVLSRREAMLSELKMSNPKLYREVVLLTRAIFLTKSYDLNASVEFFDFNEGFKLEQTEIKCLEYYSKLSGEYLELKSNAETMGDIFFESFVKERVKNGDLIYRVKAILCIYINKILERLHHVGLVCSDDRIALSIKDYKARNNLSSKGELILFLSTLDIEEKEIADFFSFRSVFNDILVRLNVDLLRPERFYNNSSIVYKVLDYINQEKAS